MTEPRPRRAEQNAGAFLTPTDFSMIPVPMRTLSDDYHDEPAEPRDSETVPPPAPEGAIRRVVRRLAGRSRP